MNFTVEPGWACAHTSATAENATATCKSRTIVNKDAEAPRTAQVAIPQDTNPQKKELRREMRRLVKTLPQDSPTVLQILRDWITRHPQVKIISTYAPLPGEVDLTPLVTEFANLRWVFPRVEQSELVLHEVSDPSLDLEPGAFDIREPKPDLTVVNLFHVDAFLCPGLAFDDYGGRLGRGRGFYDRLLEHARRDAFKVGICHTEQLVPHTYGESHDVAMDLVISA